MWAKTVLELVPRTLDKGSFKQPMQFLIPANSAGSENGTVGAQRRTIPTRHEEATPLLVLVPPLSVSVEHEHFLVHTQSHLNGPSSGALHLFHSIAQVLEGVQNVYVLNHGLVSLQKQIGEGFVAGILPAESAPRLATANLKALF